jgi:hypothetical protein
LKYIIPKDHIADYKHTPTHEQALTQPHGIIAYQKLLLPPNHYSTSTCKKMMRIGEWRIKESEKLNKQW